MTGNPSWSALDLDDERLGEECVDIVERLGATWIKVRLDFYDDWITKLFKPDGKLLAEAPTRVAQIKAETLLMWMAHEDLESMQVSSERHELLLEIQEHDSNQDCWLAAYSFLSLLMNDLVLIDHYGCRDEKGRRMEPAELTFETVNRRSRLAGKLAAEEYERFRAL